MVHRLNIPLQGYGNYHRRHCRCTSGQYQGTTGYTLCVIHRNCIAIYPSNLHKLLVQIEAFGTMVHSIPVSTGLKIFKPDTIVGLANPCSLFPFLVLHM